MENELSHHFLNKLKWFNFFIFMLSSLDGVLTIISVFALDAQELNPLMAYLINYHPVLFMICKQLLAGIGTVILWRFRENLFAICSIVIIFSVYIITLIHQLRWISIIFIQSLIY